MKKPARYDFVILGGGAAAFAAAIEANAGKKKTLMVNDTRVGLGGTCVNTGCLPTKHLLHLAGLAWRARHNPFRGVTLRARTHFARALRQKNALVARLRKEKYARVLDGLEHVSLVRGTARFLSRRRVAVGERVFEAKKLLIATGSSTRVPPVPGLQETGFLTHATALSLPRLPRRLAIVGAGAVGLEFAQFFARMGARVFVLERGPRILAGAEPDLARLLQTYLEKEGITFHLNASLSSVSRARGQKTLRFLQEGKTRTLSVDDILVAAGRRPNTARLGLERAGVALRSDGAPRLNAFLQTTNPRVYAAGDAAGEPMLETVAAKEGKTAAHNAFSKKPVAMDYRVVPRAVFTSPELASVGLTDEQAQRSGTACACRTVPLALVPKARAVLDTRGAVKVVAEARTGRVLGVSILSEHAADLVHEAALIVQNRMTVRQVADTLHVFPTHAEAVKIACQAFFRDVSVMSCCVE